VSFKTWKYVFTNLRFLASKLYRVFFFFFLFIFFYKDLKSYIIIFCKNEKNIKQNLFKVIIVLIKFIYNK